VSIYYEYVENQIHSIDGDAAVGMLQVSKETEYIY
jgi:hypothetical protein